MRKSDGEPNEAPLYKLTEYGEEILSTKQSQKWDKAAGVALGCFGFLGMAALALAISVAISAGVGWVITRFVITPFWEVEFNPAWIASSIVVFLLIALLGRGGSK